jgi:hypothetical protein
MPKHLLTRLPLLLSLALTLGACAGSSSPDDLTGEDESTYSLTFVMATAGRESATRTDQGSWGDGYTGITTLYDDVIDVSNIRVGIMDSTGNFVTTLHDLKCIETAEGRYQCIGSVESALFTRGAEYRCVVVVNRPTFDFENILPSSIRFDVGELPNAATDDDCQIPMWGVKVFGIPATGSSYDLGSLQLLKAAVKCRIRLSSALQKAGYSLENLQLHLQSSAGYLIPRKNSLVYTTQDLSYSRDDPYYCFNPLTGTATATIGLRAEPGSTDGSLIAYFPEQNNKTTAPVYISLDVRDKQGNTLTYKVDFKDYTTGVLIPDLVRNHIYDFEITGFSYGLELNLDVAEWVDDTQEIDFTTVISGDLDIAWSKGTYSSLNAADKKLTVLSGTPAVGKFKLLSPQGNTWVATLTNSSHFGFQYANAATGMTDTLSTLSGIIDGKTTTIRIVTRVVQNAQQEQAKLTFTLKYNDQNQTSTKITQLSDWVLIQPRQ